MGALEKFMRRLGFARLDRYGLILTPDDRILAARPAVLDDGMGGRIVGWREADLAAMELTRWAPAPAAKASPKRQVYTPELPTSVAPVTATPAAVAFAPPTVAPPTVAPPTRRSEPVIEDDEWEWEIAMARARAAAEEIAATVEQLAQPIYIAPVATIAHTAPPPAPATSAALRTAIASQDWSEPEPMRVVARYDSVKTVIPVPQLPTVRDGRELRPPVVARAPMPSLPRRMPRATSGISDDTVRTHAAPANEDRTSPGIAMPPAAGATRRVAAKQR